MIDLALGFACLLWWEPQNEDTNLINMDVSFPLCTDKRNPGKAKEENSLCCASDISDWMHWLNAKLIYI